MDVQPDHFIYYSEMVAGRNERVDNLVGSVPQRLFHSKHLEVDGAATKTFGKETVPIQDKSDQLWIGILSQVRSFNIQLQYR